MTTPTTLTTPTAATAPSRSSAATSATLIPKLGLRNYWYPAIEDRKVGSRKPVKVALLGEEICLFRGADRRGRGHPGRLPASRRAASEGDCHYRGTVACPYHGWVYDESGKNVAVLSEGPDSGVCGKPGTEAKVYPTRTLKGAGVRVDRRATIRRPSRRTSPRSSSTTRPWCRSARCTGAATGRSRSRTRWTRT